MRIGRGGTVAGTAIAALALGLLPTAPALAAAAPSAPADPIDAAVAAAEAAGATVSVKPSGDPAEQVVALDPTTGEVVRLTADSPQDAAALADRLDARPGLVAAVNHTYATTAATKAGRSVGRPPAASAPASHDPTREPRYSRQWGLSWLGLPGAWSASTGAGVTVAVLDTGVDAGHPDLSARVLPGADLVDPAGDGRRDPNGHGTFVAGIIAAALDGTGVVGAAEDASVLPIRVLDDAGSGDTATVAAGVRRAVALGATVLNLSLGGPSEDPVLAAAITAARGAGAVVVAAAGNEFAAGNPVEYPAATPGVLGVTAIASDGSSAPFANVGDYVDLAAPGVDVWSDLPGGRVGSGDGTSFAAPYVAAAAALVRSAAPTLTGDQVAELLQATAQDDSAGDGRDPVFGAGLVRADRALTAAGATVPGSAEPPTGTTAQPGSTQAGAQPGGSQPSAVPAGVTGVGGRLSRRAVRIAWTAVDGATGYLVAIRLRTSSGWSAWRSGSAAASATGGTWRAWRPARAAQVRVLAVNQAGRGAWSTPVVLRTH